MSVRGVFDWSYRGLRPATARVFRLLGLHPGPDASLAAAASLGGCQEAEVRGLLRELTRACLLTEPVPGRYTCHDLLREYAAELAGNKESEAERNAALRRLYGCYLHTAFAALRLSPKRRPIDLEPTEPGVNTETFTSEAAALSWLDAERAVLLAAITSAHRLGLGRPGWQLAWTLSDYFSYRGHWPEWHAALRAAATATQQAGDLAGQVVVLRHLGQAAASLGDYNEAREHLERCVALCEQAGDQVSEAAAHHDCARICYFQGELTAALGHAQRSLHLSRAVGQPAGLASALNGVGWCLAQLGEHEQALRYCEEALELNREIGNRAGEAMTLDSVGYIHHQLSHHANLYRDYFSRPGRVWRIPLPRAGVPALADDQFTPFEHPCHAAVATLPGRQAEFLARLTAYERSVGSPYATFLTEFSPASPDDLHTTILRAVVTGSLADLCHDLNQSHGPAAFTRLFKTIGYTMSSPGNLLATNPPAPYAQRTDRCG